MPAAKARSPQSRKSKTVKSRSTRKPPVPKSPARPKGAKRFACRAWWCGSTFGRYADMIRHVGTEHFGKRSYCTICLAAMKQDSNMGTHLNVHLSNNCTICSCGQGFTDPSAYTRHREANGHEKGVTHGKVRPAIIKGIKVQHRAGLTINLDLISDPNFVPPAFDASYHLKGKPKPKAQEKYNPTDYTELSDAPLVPSFQTGPSSTGGALATEYEEVEPSPMQSEIKVDELGIDADYSYDVVLPQEFECNQVPETDEHIECHNSPAVPSTEYSHIPPHGYSPEQEVIPYHAESCVPTETMHYNRGYTDLYPPRYQEAIVPNTNNYFPPPQHPFAEPRVQPEYQTIPPQGFFPDCRPMLVPSFYTHPSQQTHHIEARFGVGVHEQFQQPQFRPVYQYSANPHDQAPYPAIAGY